VGTLPPYSFAAIMSLPEYQLLPSINIIKYGVECQCGNSGRKSFREETAAVRKYANATRKSSDSDATMSHPDDILTAN
jgi:hypothetical protein